MLFDLISVISEEGSIANQPPPTPDRMQSAAITIRGASSVTSFVTSGNVTASNVFPIPNQIAASDGLGIGAAHWVLNNTSGETVGVSSSGMILASPSTSSVSGGDGMRLGVAYESVNAGGSLAGDIIRQNDTSSITEQVGRTLSFFAYGGVFVDSSGHQTSERQNTRQLTLPTSQVGDIIVIVSLTRGRSPVIDGFGLEYFNSFNISSGTDQFISVHTKTAAAGDSGRVVVIDNISN